MTPRNLNPLINQFLGYHLSGSCGIHKRDEVFQELHLAYSQRFAEFFVPLSREDKKELSQEIALMLFTHLLKLKEKVRPNPAGHLFKWLFAAVNNHKEKLRERKQYEVPGVIRVTSPVVPLYKDYRNKFGDLVPALEVVRMYKEGMTVIKIVRHFKCNSVTISQIIKNADIPLPREKPEKYASVVNEWRRLRLTEKMTYKAIGRRYGCGGSVVSNYLKRYFDDFD